MKLLVTADLHFNHGRSKQLARQAIAEINHTDADALLLVGDTATADEGQLEEALSSVTFTGPKLFLCGNHELWTRRPDSYAIFTEELPNRIRALGWHWLEGDPVMLGDTAVIGSVGWYDYSFAPEALGIPKRFYEAKVSPGAAEHLKAYQHLLNGEDIPPESREIVARWNDGKFIKLGRSDEVFLSECVEGLRRSLVQVAHARRVIAAVHHIPFSALLPPRHAPMWDFVRAYLGSDRLGKVLLADPRISHVFSGHSHFAADVRIDHLHAINIGSGYRQKYFKQVDI